MPKGNPHPGPGRRWKKGESGNVKGQPVLPEEYKVLRRMTKAELADVGNEILKGGIEQINVLLKDKKTPVLKLMVATIAAKIIKQGDMHAFDILMNRLVGKVKDEMQISGNIIKVNIDLPSNGFERQLEDHRE